MRSRIRKRLIRNSIIALAFALVAVFACVMLLTQIKGINAKSRDMEERERRLDLQIEEQQLRQKALDDEENYVKTREYIEEKAKSIGYVYPDEIIFKRED